MNIFLKVICFIIFLKSLLSQYYFFVNRVLQNDNNGEYFIVEPNIKAHNVFKLTHYEIAFEQADIIVFLVAHNEFKELKNIESKVLLDFCGVTNS